MIDAEDKDQMLKQLCEFVESTDFDHLPISTITHAKDVVMDTFGVILAGSKDSHLNQLADFLAFPTDKEASTRLGHKRKFTPLHAALLNGAAGSSQEFEEGHSKALGHPAIQLIPAAFAHAEATRLGGKKFLEGVILGYEVAARLGSSAPLRPGLHPSSSWGIVGAAISVAKLSGFKTSEIFEVMNIASSFTIAGFVKNSLQGRNIAQMYAAFSNYFGILSYKLFQFGFSASPETLRVTFGQLLSDRLIEERLSKGLGERYLIETNYFKMYPTCRFTHPAIEALHSAVQNKSIDIEHIDRIDVYTFKWALEMSNPNPENTHGMRFSIPHLLGLFLSSGSLTLDTFKEAHRYQSLIDAIANKTFVHEDEFFNKRLPHQRGAKVEITLRNGVRIQGVVDDCKGGESAPYSASQLRAKFVELSTAVLGEKGAKKALLLLENLESLEEINQLADILGMRND